MKIFQIKAENKKIDLNVINNEFLKDTLKSVTGEKSFIDKLALLKNIARELKDEELTITISYKGGIVLTVGSSANPKLSQLVTRTNAIEINNMRKLIEIFF